MTPLNLHRRHLQNLFSAALDAVNPYKVVHRHLASQDFPSAHFSHIVAVGKAALPMAHAAIDICPLPPQAALVITSPSADTTYPSPPSFTRLNAGHPLPNADSLNATSHLLDLADSLEHEHLILCLLSGGASAMLAAPAPPLTLEDLHDTNATLIAGGLDIDDINAVRKQLSAIKGGQLAKRFSPARTLLLVISDVVGDRMDTIGSGPLSPNKTGLADALKAIQKLSLDARRKLPTNVLDHLRRRAKDAHQDTEQRDDAYFSLVNSAIIASRLDATSAAAQLASSLGWDTQIKTNTLTGAAHKVGGDIAKLAMGCPEGTCLILAGETTVNVTGTGHGGRNQEVALAAALELAIATRPITIASFATDGVDGPTRAAGAFADTTSLRRAEAAGLSPEDLQMALDNNDSATVLAAIHDQIITGTTHTNVNDLFIAMVGLPRSADTDTTPHSNS